MTRLSVIRVWAVLAVVALAAGCGGGDSATAPVVPDSPRPTTVTVSPPTAELVAGATVQLRAEVRDQNASVMAGAAVTWTSSETSVATVDAAGLVTGVSAGGPVTITATSGGQSGAAQITVLPPPVASVEVTPSEAPILVGDSEQLTAVTTDAEGNVLTGRAVTWQSSNPSVASVDVSGLVTGVSRGGPVTITATSEGQSGTAQITVLSTTDFYALTKEFVEYYWNTSFTNGDLVYSYVQVFEGYGLFPPFTPCGELVPWNAFYCSVNAGVYYHTAFLDSYLDEIGDLAPAFIISHEIGHHVSWQLGWIPGVTMSKKQNELQADCFGGAWVRWISDMDLLDTGDLEEAARTLFQIGNPEFTWFNPNLHGTSLQRLLAFAAGFDDGAARCTSTEWLGQFPTSPAEAPARPLGEGARELDSPPALTPGKPDDLVKRFLQPSGRDIN